MYKNAKFMICFGDVRQNPAKLRLWQTFMKELLATDMWKATNYDKWDPEGGDWGWISSSSSTGDVMQAMLVLKELGFSQSSCPWDRLTLRFDAGLENEPPSIEDLSRVALRTPV